MKITLVRHGQTDYNKNRTLVGTKNVSLNDCGRKESQELKKKIKDNHYDICFCSPLIRAMETAMILVGERVEIIRDDRLIERNIGDFEEKNIGEYDYDKYWDYNVNSGDNNVEKIQDLYLRINDFLNYIENKYKDKEIIIVSHLATTKMLYYILNKKDFKNKIINYHIKNCEIEEIEIN